ncbi:nitrate reductase molybdenum cofactor assembly chaperone [Spartinivicinus poritis]|uniref:Nitrate reductase molybdenum cofactor assembly chaperone n=1 Tax=Spartinivicinus poritis TaxID=2994640 RepID=A0ABT5U992_9GAMM|nr:nitrate reductase molybdenum cofactor assembly chaperone [Spartinivicinus sp. A2-2]MDE1462872.1 nitrate reductase molybdenum cofactor assembly chaperone [Spartinivicinus sp. A2-2]
MKILKIISLLLDYPSTELQQGRGELAEAIERDQELAPKNKAVLIDVLNHLTTTDLMDRQEEYVGLFDRGRAVSLLLFEHVHGESRDRGQAMVDLMELYKEQGFHISVRELPDYLPLFLEFLTHQDQTVIQQQLVNIAPILAVLKVRLAQRESIYSRCFEVLLELADVRVDLNDLQKQVANEEPDYTPEAIDKVWEEEQVTFGLEGNSCNLNTKPKKAKEELPTPIHFVTNPSSSNTTNSNRGARS